MIIVDSSVWIDYFNGIKNFQTDLLDQYLFDGQIQILDIILAEVLQGFRDKKDYDIARELMISLPCHQSLSKKLAVECAGYYRMLRKKGVTVRKTIDMIIACWCIDANYLLLENDKDFIYIADILPLNILREQP